MFSVRSIFSNTYCVESIFVNKEKMVKFVIEYNSFYVFSSSYWKETWLGYPKRVIISFCL